MGNKKDYLIGKGKVPIEAITSVVLPFIKTKTLNIRQRKIIQGVANGKDTKQIAKEIGITSSGVNKTLNTPLMQGALGIALENAGLSDDRLALKLKKTMRGAGRKATNGDAIRAIELAAKLKGHLSKEPETVNNTYINELKVLSIDQLEDRARSLSAEIDQLK